MNPDDLAAILDQLGQRLGPAGERVFELAVRQQVIANGLWTAFFAAAVLIAGTVAIRQVRGMWSIDRVIDALEASMADHSKKDAELEAKVRAFESEKEAAKLAAMTDEQRASWYDRMAFTRSFGNYGFGYGSPSVSDLKDHNGTRLVIAGFAGAVALIGVLGLLISLPPLLNPEYAAIRDILSAVHP